MIYFKVQPVDLSISPFQTKTVNAIMWTVKGVVRDADVAELDCVCLLVDTDGNPLERVYEYSIPVPKTILSTWLDDSVIDNYIISQSNGTFVKVI